MTEQLFDQLIRDKLGDHASPVPDDLWNRIEREQARRRRPFLLPPFAAPRYWLATSLLLLGAAAGIWLLRKGSDSPAIARQAVNGIQANQSTGSVVNNPSGLSNTTTHLPATSSDTTTTTPIAATEDTPPGNAPIPATAGRLLYNGNNTVGKYRKDARHTRPDQAAAARQNLPWFSLPAAAGKHATHITAPATLAAANGDLLESSYQFVPLANGQPELLHAFSPGNTFSLKSLLEQQQNKKMFPVIRCPDPRGPGRNDWYVEVYGSPDYIQKTVAASGLHSSGYLQRKDSSESRQLSFSLGARFSKNITPNLLAKIGFQYTQVNETFSYQQENERKQVTVVTTHTIIQAPGDTVVVRDTSTYQQIGYRKRATANKYKSIDLPLLLSYEWGNDQWKIAANAGAIINLYSWYNGQVFDTSYQPVSIAGKSPGIYKSNIGLGLYAGLSILKPVSENMELFAEPYIRYNLSNMTQPGQPFSQKFKTIGLSLGIRYKLNGLGQRSSWR